MAHKDGYGAANGRRTPDKLQQPQGRRILLLPLLLALGLFSVSFACSKFLTPHGAGGRPDDNDTRLSARGSAGASAGASAEEDEAWNSSDDCLAGARFALQGVDLVAYFSMAEGDEPVIGSPSYASTYGDGYEFMFSSAKNLALFEENPTTYLPAYGGFCSYGIPMEENWSATHLGPPIDINSWIITGGTLRLFRTEDAKAYFLEDEDEYTEAGDSRWASWFGDDSTAYPFDVSCFCTVDTC